MSKIKTENLKPVITSTRIPMDLFLKILKIAEKEERSLSNVLYRLLKESIAEREGNSSESEIY